tara:strand:+ start:303 stop:1778 length:1476 start_codon:yes stop_codon:yes gene_type:complete
MKNNFFNINDFKVDKNNEDSYEISLNIKNAIYNFVHQKLFSELIKKYSSMQNLPEEVISRKSKQIINGYFNYKEGKFNKTLGGRIFFKDSLIYLLIMFWGFFFSKKINLKKKLDIIIDDIGDDLAYKRLKKLMGLFTSCLAITNGYKNEKADNKFETINFLKVFLFSSDFFGSNKIKNLIFFFNLISISMKYKFNFLLVFKIIMYTSCKYNTLFKKYKSKFLLNDRFYRTCPVRNFYFKKNGGLITACTQKNICETTISLFVYTDVFFSLGDEIYTKKRLIELGGDVKKSYPVGSLFMEHDWFSKKKDIESVPNVDILILGLNPNTWLYVNKINNINYLKTILGWIKQISLESPNYSILIKHHGNLNNNENEKIFFKDTNVKTQIKTKSVNASYGFLEKSKIAFSFGSTMILEGIGNENECFYLDPNLQTTCFFKGLNNLSKIRIKNYQEFRDKIVEVTNSKRKTNLDKNSLCLKSDKVSNRIYEYLNSKA